MYATQTVERTDMAPLELAGWQWQCRADRVHRFRLIYRSLVQALSLPGDIAEIGCWIGLTSFELARYIERRAPDKTLHCFESFQGLDQFDENADRERGDWIALPDMERQFFARMASRSNWQLWKGHVEHFAQPGRFEKPLCWAYVDVDIYRPTVDAIQILQANMVPGGVAVFDDYGADKWWPGVRKAVDQELGNDWQLEKMPEEHMWLCFARRLR